MIRTLYQRESSLTSNAPRFRPACLDFTAIAGFFASNGAALRHASIQILPKIRRFVANSANQYGRISMTGAS
jgi:hypothetical protein